MTEVINPVGSAIDYLPRLAKISFDEVFDLTAEIFYYLFLMN